jgi:hypothetical protein
MIHIQSARKPHTNIVNQYQDLYRSVPVLLNKCERVLVVRLRHEDDSLTTHKCDIPTTKGCNADDLLRTLRARPDLAKYTKNLWLLRCDRGFGLRNSLGWYGYGDTHGRFCSPFIPSLDLKNMQDNTELPYRVWGRLKRAALPLEQVEITEQVSNVLRNILRLLPNVLYLDRTEYFTDVPWDASLDVVRRASRKVLPGCQLPFAHLREVRMCCGTNRWSKLWPLFTLPVLRTLSLRGGFNDPARPVEIFNWKGIISSIESIGIEIDEPRQVEYHPEGDESDPLYLMSAACDELQTLSLITIGYEMTGAVLLPAFRKRIDTVHEVALYDRNSRLSHYGAAPENGWVHTHALDLLRSAGSLRTLTMDVTDLVYLIADEKRTPELRGWLNQHIYTFGTNPQRYWLYVKLDFPRSLETLRLRVADERDQQIAVVDALRGTSKTVRERFSDLKEIKLIWHDSAWYPGATQQLVVVPFARLGIEVTEEFLGTPMWRRQIYEDKRIRRWSDCWEDSECGDS